MVRLREISRTAAFAWSPGAGLPMLATGTKAGAVDADFSAETKLEIWNLGLEDNEQGGELQPVISIATESGFHDIAWAPANDTHPKGVIAGALDSGALQLWDVQKLLDNSEDALISQNIEHTTAITSVQFNPLKPQFLASVGAKGELFIHDINDPANTSRLGNPQARPDDLKCVAWNRKVPHILATGSAAGVVTVWDIRTKKPSVILNNNRKAVGAIAWDPNNPTKLLTATPDDLAPVIYLWDLRSSSAPERELQGHQEGVLSLSWCQQDADLMLSCGKDNRTLCWNPQTGEQLGEISASTNWAMFQTSFHPHLPSLFATASLDGKISVYSIQSANQPVTQNAVTEAADGEDFFQMAPTQPQGPSFDLKKAPKWLQRPIGASFGFGGKLVVFSNIPAAAGTDRKSTVKISNFSADEDVVKATEEFEESLKTNDMVAICDSHIQNAATEDEIADWTVIKSLVSENPRSSVTDYLGFSKEEDSATMSKESETSETTAEENIAALKDDDASGFFEKSGETVGDDDFLANLPATKTARTNDPFQLFADSDSTSDKEITKALMLGQFEKAMNVCLKEGKMADAFVIANCGGEELFMKAQKAYLGRASDGPKYLRLLNAVIGKNLWDIVYNADLANWKETMAAICTYADPKEFSDLCEALGDRMLEDGARKDASFCYIVGSKLEKVVDIWIVEFQEQEQAGVADSSEASNFSIHARALQNFIEKVTVFRQVAKFQDAEKESSSGWKLNALYVRYIEYADILASHGHLETAEKYLNLLPTQFPAAEITRSRVKQASKKSTAAVQARKQQPQTSRPNQRVQPAVGAFQPPASMHSSASNIYSQPTPPAPVNSYAPPSQPYMSQSSYTPASTGPTSFNTQGYSAGGYSQPSPYGQFGAPPPAAAAPSIPPPSKAKDMSNWNDTPMVTKPVVSRRSTPMNAPPAANQFSPPVSGNAPPVGPPFGGPPRATPTPPPPPPKASAVPRVSSPLNSMASGPFQQPPRPASTSNAYAPSPLQGSQSFAPPAPQPTIARGASPFIPPPSGPPPTSRYAPAPAAQQVKPQLPGQVAPPPQVGMRGPPPPSNPFAPQQAAASPGPYGQTQPPPSEPPRQMPGPPRASTSSRPPTAQSPAPATKPAISTPRYPPGDRSHIPAHAQEMVAILSNDMQRVAAKAPANFAPQVKDTQKRLNILFDHLNNEDLVKPDTVGELNELARALQARNYDLASKMQLDIQRDKLDECGNWMVGIKRLISMSKVTP